MYQSSLGNSVPPECNSGQPLSQFGHSCRATYAGRNLARAMGDFNLTPLKVSEAGLPSLSKGVVIPLRSPLWTMAIPLIWLLCPEISQA